MRPAHADIVAAVLARPMPGVVWVAAHEIKSRMRSAPLVDARCLIAVIERERSAASYGELGLRMGRDHSSIRHLVKKYWPRRRLALQKLRADIERDLGVEQ